MAITILWNKKRNKFRHNYKLYSYLYNWDFGWLHARYLKIKARNQLANHLKTVNRRSNHSENEDITQFNQLALIIKTTSPYLDSTKYPIIYSYIVIAIATLESFDMVRLSYTFGSTGALYIPVLTRQMRTILRPYQNLGLVGLFHVTSRYN